MLGLHSSAVSTNVRGVDVESGALIARTQDEGAVWTALRTRTPRAAFSMTERLAGRTVQRLVDVALGAHHASRLHGVFFPARYLYAMGRIDKRRGTWLLVFVLVLVAAACNTRPTPDAFDSSTTTTGLGSGTAVTTIPPTLPPPEEQVVASVVSVTDGDTVRVRINAIEFDVRMLGINAPEREECWGPESTAHLTAMIGGLDVFLVSGEQDTDEFGRLLRYIFLDEPSGPILVNSVMVENGNALGLSNGHEHERSFKSLEASAFQSGAGMWGTFVCGDAEGTSADRPVVRVSMVLFDPTGPDNENLDEEYVTIVNEGYGRVSMSGWVLRDESSRNRMTFPADTVLAPGDEITVVTGCSGGPTGSVHWCNDGAVWSNQGDTVIVSDTLGNAVVWYNYTGEDAGS